jgi:toxin ParE1/3/4
LKSIETYLIDKTSPKIAKQEVEKILRRTQQLSELPDTGHKVKGYEATQLREVLIRPYRIIYLPKESQVDVISVMRYRRLFEMDLADFSKTKH